MDTRNQQQARLPAMVDISPSRRCPSVRPGSTLLRRRVMRHLSQQHCARACVYDRSRKVRRGMSHRLRGAGPASDDDSAGDGAATPLPGSGSAQRRALGGRQRATSAAAQPRSTTRTATRARAGSASQGNLRRDRAVRAHKRFRAVVRKGWWADVYASVSMSCLCLCLCLVPVSCACVCACVCVCGVARGASWSWCRVVMTGHVDGVLWCVIVVRFSGCFRFRPPPPPPPTRRSSDLPPQQGGLQSSQLQARSDRIRFGR